MLEAPIELPEVPIDMPEAPADVLTQDLKGLSSLCARDTYSKDEFVRHHHIWPRRRLRCLAPSSTKLPPPVQSPVQSPALLCCKCRKPVILTALKKRALIYPSLNSRKRKPPKVTKVPAKRLKTVPEHAHRRSRNSGARSDSAADSTYALTDNMDDAVSTYSFTSSEFTDQSNLAGRSRNINGDICKVRRNSIVSHESGTANWEDFEPPSLPDCKRHKRQKRERKRKQQEDQRSPGSYSSLKSDTERSSHVLEPTGPGSAVDLARTESHVGETSNPGGFYTDSDNESGNLVIDLGPDDIPTQKNPSTSKDDLDEGNMKQVKSNDTAFPRQPLTLKFTTKKTEYCKLSDGRELRVQDIVWAKVQGYPWWPSRIVTLYQMVKDEKMVEQTADILWYGATSWSPCECEDLYPFVEFFKEKFNKKRKSSYLKAVKAAAEDIRREQFTCSPDGSAEVSLGSESANLMEVLALAKPSFEPNKKSKPDRAPRQKWKVPREKTASNRLTRSSACNGGNREVDDSENESEKASNSCNS